MMYDENRHRAAREAANQAHELERYLLHLAEALRRDEAPDQLVFHSIPGALHRLKALSGEAVADEAMRLAGLRAMFRDEPAA